MTDNIQEAIEDKIIDLINSKAKGRLVIFKPENSDKDLVVEKRGDYKKEVLFLKIYGKEFLDASGFNEEIHQLAVKQNLGAEDNFYLLFVYFNIVKQDVNENFLVIPSLILPKLVGEKDFSKFMTTKENFVRFLIDLFNKK